ncbi:MAG: hypothetical protein AB7S26_33275 [Sandaracinaceae bacterium]
MPRSSLLALALLSITVGASAQAPTSTRDQAAHRAYDLSLAALRTGTGDAERVYAWSLRWAESEPARVASMRAHLTRMTELQRLVDAQVSQGTMTPEAAAAAAWYVADARWRVEHGGP